MPDHRVLLTGAFRVTHDCRSDQDGTSARWMPTEPIPSAFRRLTIPSLLLDALARVVALRPGPDGAHRVVAPRSIRSIELFTTGNDHGILQDHPTGLHLQWERDRARWSAITDEGLVLARINDMVTTPMGDVPPSTE